MTPAETQDKKQEATPVAPADLCKKTTGEKMYGWLKFGVAETFILFATAVIAYWARHGKEREGLGRLLNPFKLIQDGFKWLLTPIAKQGETGAVIAGAATSTMVTFHGGNAFAPAMKWFDGKKNDIVDAFNKRFGTPEETKIAQEKLKDDPKQSWGDVIKGRLVSWGIVFASFLSATFLIGKDSEKKMWRFDKYEEGFGRWLAGLTKKGKELNIGLPKKTGIPLSQKLEGLAAENKTYRFGKILALDIYATTAVILIWSAVSEFFAKSRQKEKAHKPQEIPTQPATEIASDCQPCLFTDTIQQRTNIKAKAASHAEAIASSRQADVSPAASV